LLQETWVSSRIQVYGGKTNHVNNVVISNDVFYESCQKGQENGEYHLTAQQYQVLSDLFRQSTSNNTTNNAQVKQVGSLTADNHKIIERSPTGNILTLNSSQHGKNYWILDSGAIDQVCSSLSEFTSYKNIKPIPISLHNGHVCKILWKCDF